MSVLITIFITAVIALFTGVFNQGKYARYVGILGLGIALYVSFLPDCTFLKNTMRCLAIVLIQHYLPKYLWW